MSTIIELRKQELTTEINKMINIVQFFIDNKKRKEKAASISQYLDSNQYELNNVKNSLQLIEYGFNPDSDSFETFEKCKNQLEELQIEINKIQSRGEAEQERLRRNSSSWENAGVYAGFGAGFGGLAFGLSGCVSCVNHRQLPWELDNFNLITGLLIGAIGCAVVGAVMGAIIGQLEDALGIHIVVIACFVIGVPALSISYCSRKDAVSSTTVSYDIPAIRASVTSFRFYEKGDDSLPLNARNYGHTFTKSKTRYVNWEINLEYPQNRSRVDFAIKYILYRGDGSIMSEQTMQTYVNPDWTGSNHTSGWGQNKFGNWQAGSYRVELYIDGKIVANDSFTVR
jgi:hypothetical protein